MLVHPPRVAESGRHFRYVTSPLPRMSRFYKYSLGIFFFCLHNKNHHHITGFRAIHPQDNMTYNLTAKEAQPARWLHLNGTPDQILDRYCVSELLRGWPVYRDASEWKNYRACFADDAYVFSSTSPTHPLTQLPSYERSLTQR